MRRAMSRLDEAAERLRSALSTLDATVGPLAEARKAAKEAQARISALTVERERLLARIAELEEDARALSGLTEEVETRLDGAIAEIRTALGR
jgi:chromosome segregation ATPase